MKISRILVIFLAVPFLCSTVVVGQETKHSDSHDADAGKVTVLFDGKNLDQFRGYKQEKIPAAWKIDGDALMFDGTGGGDIVTKNSYTDFELEFEWKVSAGANSGVMYRVTLGDGAPYISGPEYQILDDAKHRDGKNVKTSAASIYAMYAPNNKKQLKPVGEWNSAKIVLNNNKLEHWLNGQMVASTILGSEEWKAKKDASKFKDWKKFGAAPKGHIAFQDHGDKIWFRNIKITELNTSK